MPMEDTKKAILDSIRELKASGERSYSHSVSDKAGRKLLDADGTLQLTEISDRIQRAVEQLVSDGIIVASDNPGQDWEIL